MKHLKSYSLYECPPDYKPWENGQFVLTVKIERKIGYYFSLKDIYSCVKRMCDYMKIEGFFGSVFVDRASYGIMSISLPEDESGLTTNLDADNDYTSCTVKFSYRTKSVNESKSDEMREDIKDILIELEDEGFTCNAHHLDKLDWCNPISGEMTRSTSTIVINKGYEDIFYYQDVKEVCDRVKEYLGSHFKHSYMYSMITSTIYGWNEISDIIIPIKGVTIEYNV